MEASLAEMQASAGAAVASEKVYEKHLEDKDKATTEGEEMRELIPEESEGEAEGEGKMEEEEDGDVEEEGLEDSEPSLEESWETNIEEVGAEHPVSGLRRRNRPE